MVQIVNHSSRIVELKGESKGHVYQREYIFSSAASASEFVSILEHNKQLQDQRAKDRLDSMLNGITLKDEEELTFLIDICSAMNLPRTDVGRDSDPYVTVRFNGRKIHKTHYISHEDNPIWSLRSKSLFLWRINARELFMSEDGLIFEVKDYDAVGENESMGAFSVQAQTLYRWKDGERRKFDLKPLLGKHDYGQVRRSCVVLVILVYCQNHSLIV
jgi:Ca2+-dependent lipid-binding protein